MSRMVSMGGRVAFRLVDGGVPAPPAGRPRGDLARRRRDRRALAAARSTAREAVKPFHEYASCWLQAKVDGVIGHKPIHDARRLPAPEGSNAQFQPRVKRERGRAFDRLVGQAREQPLRGAPQALELFAEQPLGHGLGHESRNRGRRTQSDERSVAKTD